MEKELGPKLSLPKSPPRMVCNYVCTRLAVSEDGGLISFCSTKLLDSTYREYVIHAMYSLREDEVRKPINPKDNCTVQTSSR